MNRARVLAALGAALLAIAFAWVVPLGESPDELAHLRYSQELATGRLPPPWKGEADTYEAHQPPFGYLLPALVLAASGGVELAPTANPRFDFHAPGSRAFLPPFAGPRDRLVLRLARMTQALWAALTVWAGLTLAGGRPGALPFLLAPQLLFVCGAVNNDAALVALATCALLALSRFSSTGEHPIGAGLLVSAALFTKGSALLLGVPVLVAAILAPGAPAARPAPAVPLAARWRPAPRTRLLAVAALGFGAWIGLSLVRFGSFLPPAPTASHIATVRELVGEPRWLGTLFRSFWADFGWLNTPLPWPFYLWFAVLSVAVALGLARSRAPGNLVLASALMANLGFVLAYLLRIDMQPQGRYLLPSLGAIASFGSAALPTRLQPLLTSFAVFVALASLATVIVAYS